MAHTLEQRIKYTALVGRNLIPIFLAVKPCFMAMQQAIFVAYNSSMLALFSYGQLVVSEPQVSVQECKP